jgi:hypothetical protein
MFDYKQRPWTRPLTDEEYDRATGSIPTIVPAPVVNRIHRFSVGQKVWVRDRGHGPNGSGYKIEEAIVLEQHDHPGRHPWYPNGEGYSLDGNLWWDCYPGCRVFATLQEARNARMTKSVWEFEAMAAEQYKSLNT